MLRCEHCRGHAHPALKHVHGLDVELCMDCTTLVVEARQQESRQATCQAAREILAEDALTPATSVPTVFIGHVEALQREAA